MAENRHICKSNFSFSSNEKFCEKYKFEFIARKFQKLYFDVNQKKGLLLIDNLHYKSNVICTLYM